LACSYNARRGAPVETSPMKVLAGALRLGRADTLVPRSDGGENTEIADLPSALLANYLQSALAVINRGVNGVTTAPCENSAAGGPCQTDSGELQMLHLLNNDRTAPSQAAETRGHARALLWDPQLAALARAHSQELAFGRPFSHMGANGSSPSDRLSKAGIQWVSMGENIAKEQNVMLAEAALMNEPKFQSNHRANILNPNFTIVGIGIVTGPDGALYITQEFVQVR
jgi:uncharacterized protein YkwD